MSNTTSTPHPTSAPVIERPHSTGEAPADVPAVDGMALLEQFKVNRRLAGLNLVNAMHSAAGVPTHSERMASQVFTDAMAEALAIDTGRLPGPITFNRTTTPKTRDIHAQPSKADMAWLLAAEGLSHELLKGSLPDTLSARAGLFAALVEPIKAEFRRSGLDRRGSVVLEAATRYLLHNAMPDLTFISGKTLRRWNADQCDQYENLDHCDEAGAATHAAAHRAMARLTERRRVMWAHPQGISSGLLIDRFHHTSLRGLVARDTWVHRKVAEDLTSVAALLRHPHLPEVPPPAVLGVRVIAHRRPNSSLHFPGPASRGDASRSTGRTPPSAPARPACPSRASPAPAPPAARCGSHGGGVGVIPQAPGVRRLRAGHLPGGRSRASAWRARRRAALRRPPQGRPRQPRIHGPCPPRHHRHPALTSSTPSARSPSRTSSRPPRTPASTCAPCTAGGKPPFSRPRSDKPTASSPPAPPHSATVNPLPRRRAPVTTMTGLPSRPGRRLPFRVALQARRARQRQLQLTPDEVEFFSPPCHTTVREAIDFRLRAIGCPRPPHYGVSTIYAAWSNVSEPIREGAKHGAKRQRAIEATYPAVRCRPRQRVPVDRTLSTT